MTRNPTLRAPFPWFGGKSRVASIVWERFGRVRNYVEPFAGSLAVLLGRPNANGVETVNDANAYLANFWRAIAGENADPDAVAYYADWPVNEADLHARHRWLVESAKDRLERAMSDPTYFDAKVAGWWVWGQCLWIGSGWCTPADVERRGRHQVGGKAHGVHAKNVHANGTAAENIVDWKVRPDLSSPNGRGGALLAGSELPRKRPLLTGNGGSPGVHKQSLSKKSPRADRSGGRTGVLSDLIQESGPSRQVPHLSGDSGAAGQGIHATGFNLRTGGLYAYMRALAERLRRTRVCCGDWSRVVTPAVTTCIGTTAILLDPPYHGSGSERAAVYSHDDDRIWNEAKDWAIANGNDPLLRIALCGYEGDHEIPESWECVAWRSAGGYGRSERGRSNRGRERVWFSPHCLNSDQTELLAGVAND